MNLYGVLTLWAQSRFSQSRSIVGAAGAEAARTALAAGDFGTVYQRVAVFGLLGMVAATERARGHLSLVELHVPDGTRLKVWYPFISNLLVCKVPIQLYRWYDRTQAAPPWPRRSDQTGSRMDPNMRA